MDIFGFKRVENFINIVTPVGVSAITQKWPNTDPPVNGDYNVDILHLGTIHFHRKALYFWVQILSVA